MKEGPMVQALLSIMRVNIHLTAVEHLKCSESEFRCALSVKCTSILKIQYKSKNGNYLINNVFKHVTCWNDHFFLLVP